MPLRTEIAGLEKLRLEPWELKAARRAVAAGGEAPSERDRTLLRAVALRLKAEEETGAPGRGAGLSAAGGNCSVRRRPRSDGVPALDAALSSVIDEAEAVSSSEEIRAWTRTRFRLLRATAGPLADAGLAAERPARTRG